jgi:signal transduction histidine kinase/CheY-like chemotaxis protein
MRDVVRERLLWRAMDWFVPAPQLAASEESARGARALVGFCFTSVFAGLLFSGVYWLTLSEEVRIYAAGAIGAFALVVVGELLIGRRWWGVHAGGATLSTSLALSVCIIIWFTGGADSPALWWYVLLPMFGLIDWARWQSLAVVLLGGALLVGWNLIDTPGHPVGRAISDDVYRPLRFMVQLGLFSAVAAVTLAYGLSKDAAMRELARVGAEAIAANSVKSAFLANMSHELRTPLTAILGFTDATIEQFEPGSEKWIWLDIVRRNGHHMLELVNDILDLSRIEAGKLELERTRFSPFELIAEVASLMRVRAEARSVGLDVHFATPLPTFIETDPRRARQIIINLVGNAIKFTEVGTVTLSAALVQHERGTRIEIEVADTGIGMSDAQVLALFAPFSQGDSSTSRKYGGSGLGLAISQSLAQKFGGTISAASTLGSGSQFRFSIPTGVDAGAACVTHTLESILDELSARAKGSALAVGLCAGRRVLLAEDGRDNQVLIAMLLRRAGAIVTIVGDGRAAVENALRADRDAEPYDVVLMDMQMPVLDGLEATRTLRARGYPHGIIALTANAMAGDRGRCIAAGCDDFLAKPIDKETLVAAVAASEAAKPELSASAPT